MVTLARRIRYDEYAKIDFYNHVELVIRAWSLKGDCLFELGRYQEALESYNRVLELDSNSETVDYQDALEKIEECKKKLSLKG